MDEAESFGLITFALYSMVCKITRVVMRDAQIINIVRLATQYFLI